ncbi:alpha/beta-hydrolase family protein [Candidatus Nomurabacteria bacterium]|nr:alpha/beta-hydrolase family protein [Candidatus Nomurabacteria bacterium]
MKKKFSLQSAQSKFINYNKKLSYLGLVFALIFFLLSLLPSLLPRPWLYQGLISGVSIAIGYGLGVLTSKIVRWFLEGEIPENTKNIAWKILVIAGPILTITFLFLGASWQNQVRELLTEPPLQGRHMIRILFLSLVIFILIISIARFIRKLTSCLNKIFLKFVSKKVGILISVGTILVFSTLVINGVFIKTFVGQSNNIYNAKNNTTPAGISQPTSPYRSGSPESLIPWETLGYQGQNFVSRGPNQTQLQAFGSSSPKEQIRIYAGINSASNSRERAKLAVAELKRTDAFTRKVLIVATATGTGWLEPQSVDSLEYMYSGDSAIVSQQYSYLPSWISFLVDQENATSASRIV